MVHRISAALCLTALASAACAAPPAAAPKPEGRPVAPLELRFDTPGQRFHESCVLGNGRLGAMDFGGVDRDRIVLNESSMWSGGPFESNRTDAWKCLPEVRAKLFAGDVAGADALLRKNFKEVEGWGGWHGEDQFGCYQILGDLTLDFGGEGPRISSPSGHAQGDGKTIDNAGDADGGTKWCVNCGQTPVVWQVELKEPRQVGSYALTSGDDVPGRDPQRWVLEGSEDGKAWVELDRRDEGKPFEKRGQRRTFQVAKPGAYRAYRLTFTPAMDTFQVAEIALDGLAPGSAPAAEYARSLDVMHGVARTTYVRNGVKFTREVVVSKPDEVIAVRLRADKAGALSFKAGLSRKQNATCRAEGGRLVMAGQLPFNKPGGGGEGVKHRTVLAAEAKGGSVRATDQGLEITGADEVVLRLSAGTDLRNPAFPAQVDQRLAKAETRPFDAILAAAAADHAALMGRCQLTLPAGANSNLSTPARVKLATKAPDPALAALYFQYGRHLMVSGSRADSQLPTNLQGIWAEEYKTPWMGDFHSNINLQMNYWPAEPTNLSDCHLPLMRFIEGTAKEGAKTAKGYYNAPGWMANHTQNAWFDTSPSYIPACVGPVCGAWLAQHVWMHYDFTRDRAFLRANYPLMRGAAEFMRAVLIEDPKTGRLVTSPSNSPENAYRFTGPDGKQRTATTCIGSTFDLQITRDLFLHTAEAARLLGTDEAFAKDLDAARAKLAPTRVGADGRIMEWQEEFAEVEPHHRHSSHLWGLYPGTEVTPATPDLFEGAKKSLAVRGDESTGWSMAWKANFWARLHDGDHAEKLLNLLINRGAANLMCMHPPFQIDGNFGGCAAVAEMLLQSQETDKNGQPVIELLPALPKSWGDGEVTGLKARGNFEVDMAWKGGQVVRWRIRSLAGTKASVRCNGQQTPLTLAKGAETTWEATR